MSSSKTNQDIISFDTENDSYEYDRWMFSEYIKWKESEHFDHVTEYWDWIDDGIKMGFIDEVEPDMILNDTL